MMTDKDNHRQDNHFNDFLQRNR